MNWRKLFTYFALVLISVVVLLFGFLAYIAIVPPEEYQPDNVTIPEQDQYNLDEKTGWYTLDDGSEWMLTWRPHGGLLAVNFVDFANDNMYPKNASEFIWVHERDSLVVTFIDSAGITQKFTWTDSTGTKRTALRMDQPYYNQRELSFTNGDVSLKGTLMIPAQKPIESAAVIIHGSGTSHRDNFWYLYQADYFAKNGIMILLPDKRGSGASGGEWHNAAMEDFANDVIMGARKIQSLSIKDSLNLGFIGFSQGGAIAPLAATKFSDANFVVNVVGSVVTYNEQLKFEIYNDVLAEGVPKFIAPLVTSAYVKRAKARRPVWWEKNGDYSPGSYFKKLDIPTLIIYGDKDTNAPVEQSLRNLKEIQQTPEGKNITIKVYDNTGHAMGDPETGWIREDYLQLVTKWINNI